MSKEYDLFLDSFFRKPHRDGPDYGLLFKLSENERKEAENLLIENLDGHHKYDYSIALGYLASKKSVDRLLKIIRQDDDFHKIGAATAILMMGENWEAEECLIKLCKRRLFRSEFCRIRALGGLEYSKSRKSLECLRKYCDDKIFSIAYIALINIARMLGMEKDIDAFENSASEYYEGPKISFEEYKNRVKDKCDQVLKDLNEDTHEKQSIMTNIYI